MDKQIYSSQTVQGVVGLLVITLSLLGVQISQEERSVIETGLIAVAALGMTAYTIIGRLKANRNLKLGSRKL